MCFIPECDNALCVYAGSPLDRMRILGRFSDNHRVIFFLSQPEYGFYSYGGSHDKADQVLQCLDLLYSCTLRIMAEHRRCIAVCQHICGRSVDGGQVRNERRGKYAVAYVVSADDQYLHL